MMMNGKTGAICSFLYQLINLFGRKVEAGTLIDFQITNDDIARFLKTICTMLSIDMSIHPYQVFLEEEVFNDE